MKCLNVWVSLKVADVKNCSRRLIILTFKLYMKKRLSTIMKKYKFDYAQTFIKNLMRQRKSTLIIGRLVRLGRKFMEKTAHSMSNRDRLGQKDKEVR